MWDARFSGDTGNQALTTFDGTDLKCEMRFNKKYFSHKFKAGGVKYEIGVCIATGHIVWINGPFRCGMHDITVFRQAAIDALEEEEKVEADGGYKGESLHINTPNLYGPKQLEVMKSGARGRHETVNKRIKIFGILKQNFRHEKSFHSSCFRACCVLTQLNFETRLFFATQIS